MKLRRRTRVWLKGLAGGTLGGVGTAITSWLSLAFTGSLGSPMAQLTFGQLAVVMVAGGIASFVAYLSKSPLPDPKDDTNFHTLPK